MDAANPERRLGSDDPDARDRVVEELVSRGKFSLPVLRGLKSDLLPRKLDHPE